MDKIQGIGKKWIIYLLLILFFFILVTPREIFLNPSIIGNALATVRVIGSHPPTFDFDLPDQTVNQSSTFFLDVNCSDSDFGDVVTYYTNFTGFQINITTGIINQTGFNHSFVGNNTISITCSDGNLNTSENFLLKVKGINEAPVLSPIGPQIATEGSLFTLKVDATDPEGDNLSFFASTTIFSIDQQTGLINFTPSLSQVGNYTINISVFDGQLYDYEIISFRIVRGPYCGDSSCSSTETCNSCSLDCGECPPAPASNQESTTSSDSGEGGGATTSELTQAQPPYYKCDEKWECSDFGICSIEGSRIRRCKDVNKCDTKQKKPAESEKCEYVPTCADGIKDGNEEGIDCGGSCQPCILPNCFDNIKNQNETDVDCGGVCAKPCEIKKFAKLPPLSGIVSILKNPRKFPWLLILAISALIVMTVASDQVYVKKISKKEFEEYKKAAAKYRVFRKKLFKTVANASVITAVASIYIYTFSDNSKNLLMYLWIPGIIMVAAPIAISALIRHYAYQEYKKKTKEEGLNKTHRRGILQLISMENKLLVEIEAKIKDKLYFLASHHKFDEFPPLFSELNPMYGVLSSIEKKRNERIDLAKMESGVFRTISELAHDLTLARISKDYPEFLSILKTLQFLGDNINLDNHDSEQELLNDITEISRPHMMIVIRSKPGLVSLYNRLVEIYEYLSIKHSSLKEKDKEISLIERSFTDKIKGMAKQASMLEIIQKDSDFTSIYNGMVDLFNHYLKKQELSAKISF